MTKQFANEHRSSGRARRGAERVGFSRTIARGAVLLVLVMLLGCGKEPAPVAKPQVENKPVAPVVERRQEGTLTFEDVPDTRDTLVQRLLPYQNMRSATLVDWMPAGGGVLVATRFGDTTQLHLVAKPGAAREQITFFQDPVQEAVVRPQRASPFGMIFLKDSGGSEFDQLYFFDWQTRAWSMQTDGKSLHGGVVWSNMGDRFAYYGTARNGKDRDIYLGRVNGASERVLEKDGAFSVLDWSPDDKQLLVQKYVSISESYLYVLNLDTRSLDSVVTEPLSSIEAPPPPAEEKAKSKKPKKGKFETSPEQQRVEEAKRKQQEAASAPPPPVLSAPAANKTFFGDAKFARNGAGVYFTSDEASEFVRLHYMDLKTRSRRVLTAEVPWDISGLELSRDGRYYAFVSNEDGVDKLYLRDTQRDRPQPLPIIPNGLITALEFSPEGDRLGLTLTNAKSPADVYSIDIKQKRLDRWTSSEVGGLDANEFIEAQLVRFPSFDRREIPAFVYRAKDVGARPVLILIHGGPEAQARPAFSSMRQFFVNRLGITVIEPNVRGSTGYGKSSASLDNGLKREDAVRDIGAVLDWIATQGDLDPSRVAVMGTSYGGYMTLASLAHYSDRLRCGVDMVGISNFVSFLNNTQPYRQDLRRAEYGDERDPVVRAYLDGISPLSNAEKIKRPLLIGQGLNDPRVPATESQQIVKALRTQNIPVWFMTAADEGHGFDKKQNRDAFNAATVMFLEQYLLPNSADVDAAAASSASSASATPAASVPATP